jgi:hypothetical protein
VGWSRQTGQTRIPGRIAFTCSGQTACTSAVSAPSSLTSAQAKGRSTGWPSSGSATQAQVVTVPAGPTSTYSPVTGSPVAGSYSRGGTSTRPSAVRAPTMRRARSSVRNRPTTGPVERV